uniref:Vacuolar protein sorting-associated protein 45 n=2 Tax=Macrostomum lignano TaxID=282301 RepID=A0A1I8JIT2_9PLAT
MDVVKAIRDYIQTMLQISGQGMKILLMDQETIEILSVAYTMSEISKHEVFLLERLESPRQPMKHLKAVVFVRPTKANMQLLHAELRSPKYGSYCLFFSQAISRQDLKSLAEHDEQEVVREVQEVFADYLALSPLLFTPNQRLAVRGFAWQPGALQRCAEGLAGVLLSLKRLPFIRYQNSSANARRLAEQLAGLVEREKEGLFNFQERGATHLLVLDRREDPVTPLLNQWTYQAMVHELLGIRNNVVELGDTKVNLSAQYDDFYRDHWHVNFGELGAAVKQLMEEFQRKQQATAGKIESIGDMKNFVENYPAFKKLSGSVTKHVNLMSEISKLVGERNLLEVSELEQELAALGGEAHAHLQRVQHLIASPKVTELDALRLALLFALRYETQAASALPALRDALARRGLNEQQTGLIAALLRYGGVKARTSDLFGTQTPLSVTKRLFKGIKGVENIFTQHQPLLADLIDQACKAKLKEAAYPFVSAPSAAAQQRPADLIVFVVGGVTYVEALAVHNCNKNIPVVNVLLGGTSVINTRSFLEEVAAAVDSSAEPPTSGGSAPTGSSSGPAGGVGPAARLLSGIKANRF